MRPFRAIGATILMLAVVGAACARPQAEPSTFELPTEIVPDFVNPADSEALFTDDAGCFVALGDGVRILEVFPSARAYEVLHAGDVITSVDGTPARTREALLSILGGHGSGDALRVEGIRGGKPFSTDVELTPVSGEPGRGILGIVPETRLRVVRPSDLPTHRTAADPTADPVVLDGKVYAHSPLGGTWTSYPGMEPVQAVALDSESYAVASGDSPALVRLGDGAPIPIDPGPVSFESDVGTIEVFVGGFERALTSVGNLLLVAGTATEAGYDTYAILAVDPVDGSVAWTVPLPPSPSGQLLVASAGYRSPSGERALVTLVEEDPETGARSELVTYYLLDEQGEGVIGPLGIDRFMPTSGVTGWFDDDSLLYVADVGNTGVAVWDLGSGEHTLVWQPADEDSSDLVTVTPVGDGRHLVQVAAAEVSLVDVQQPLPVRPIARGCRYTSIGAAAGGSLPAAAPVEETVTATGAVGAEVVDDGRFVLTILHGSAGESRLLPDEGSVPGVARFVTLMKQLQAGASGDGLLTIGSGDVIRYSPELAVSLDREGPLYDSIALSGLYDAVALGSHEFDLGPEVTGRFIEGFTPAIPFLAANLDGSEEPVLTSLVDRGLLARSIVIRTGGQRIGLIGIVSPVLSDISSPRHATVSQVFPAVLAEVDRLEQRGVNKVVLVSNLANLFEEVQLAKGLTGVDVIVSGSDAFVLRNEGGSCLEGVDPVASYPYWFEDGAGREVPLVAVPGWYRCIGELNVTFDALGNVLAAEGRAVGVGFDIVPDPAVQAGVVVPLATAVGRLDAETIGVTQVELDGRMSTLRVSATNAGNLLADALREAATRRAGTFGSPPPDVAIQHAGAIRNNSVIPPGDITTSTTWGVAPYDSYVTIGEVPRDIFRVLLEQALDRIPDAGEHFPQISGFTMTYDPVAQARQIARGQDCSLVGDPGARVWEVVLNDGTVIVRNGAVVPGPPVIVATLDFLALGGECYPLGGLEFTNLGVTYQQALADYISTDLGGMITASDYPIDGGRRIIPVGSPAA